MDGLDLIMLPAAALLLVLMGTSQLSLPQGISGLIAFGCAGAVLIWLILDR